MSTIDFNAKKQARDEWEAEGKQIYRDLCECTTGKERGDLVTAFLSGDEGKKQAAIEQIQARQTKEIVDRFQRKPELHLVGFENWIGNQGRFLAYYERLIPDLDHPMVKGPMIGTCPLCGKRTFELDAVFGLWECRSCNKAGNHWALEVYLSPEDDDWDACADRADRILMEENAKANAETDASMRTPEMREMRARILSETPEFQQHLTQEEKASMLWAILNGTKEQEEATAAQVRAARRSREGGAA